MSKNHQNKLFNRLWHKLKSANPKELEVIDKFLDSQDLNAEKLINPIVAINKNITEVDEQRDKKIVIVFENYNQTQCELCKLNEISARALTSKLKHLTSITVKDLSDSRLIKSDVHDDGDYSGLYNNLEQDITLKEIQFADEGRFFGFLKNEFFSLIAIWVKHANLH